MTGRKTMTKAAAPAANDQEPAATPLPDRATLSDKQLAKAVIAGELRPRAAEVRRLAEALLRKDSPKKKGKGGKAKSGKLAKIPARKKK